MIETSNSCWELLAVLVDNPSLPLFGLAQPCPSACKTLQDPDLQQHGGYEYPLPAYVTSAFVDVRSCCIFRPVQVVLVGMVPLCLDFLSDRPWLPQLREGHAMPASDIMRC